MERRNSPVVDDGAQSVSQVYFCDVCQRDIPEAQATHERSVVHIFNRGLRPATRRVVIPDTNVGAKLLAKMGWQDDGERPGLGAKGREGRLMPVATALKRDTAGLGAKHYKRRITHKPHPPPPPPKKQRPREESRQRALHDELSGNIPEGYEALFT